MPAITDSMILGAVYCKKSLTRIERIGPQYKKSWRDHTDKKQKEPTLFPTSSSCMLDTSFFSGIYHEQTP
ncbi:MAG: hypothetical protein P1U36_09080 [Legionellaceae bacterium]|nr:hypothetical protein [Legionellaceae bacterium]